MGERSLICGLLRVRRPSCCRWRPRRRFARGRHGWKWRRLGTWRRFARRFSRGSRNPCHVRPFALVPP